MAAAGWTDADAPRVARAFLIDTGVNDVPGVYLIKLPVRKQLQALGGPARARTVKELVQAAKAYSSTPAFAKLYEGWIASRYGAVNHGIQVPDQAQQMAAMGKPDAMKNMMAQAAAEIAKNYAQMPVASMRILFPNDLKNWTNNPRTPQQQKIAAKAKEIAPMLDSNPAEFARQYALLKSMEMGGPDTWDGIEAASAAQGKAQAGQKLVEEQRAYNEHVLKVELKKRLQAFVTLARGVDFTAQTQERARRVVFVNPDYENKSSSWKMLYRLGKEPTQAAVAAAEAWLKEL
jgi:hypothetical protein